MCCEQQRSQLKGYSQSDASSEIRKDARNLHTELLGACGVANSYRTHTSRLLAGQSIEGAKQIQQIWEEKRQNATEFIARHPLLPPSA